MSDEVTSSFNVTVVADSVGPNGVRLTTMACTYPRYLHPQVMTHRVFSRNTSSSRAIPTGKMLKRPLDAMRPAKWTMNERGMQGTVEAPTDVAVTADALLAAHSDYSRQTARQLAALGLHKQHVNRIIENHSTVTVLITATEWANFFALRLHHDTQPDMQTLARLMQATLDTSTPAKLLPYSHHLPFVTKQERLSNPLSDLRLMSAGRCARVSYLTHDGKRDPKADIALARRLQAAGHMSPFEHIAQALPAIVPWDSRQNDKGWRVSMQTVSDFYIPGQLPTHCIWSGNFRGWHQWRQTLPGQDVYHGNV